MKKIFKGISYVFIFVFAIIISFFIYDKKYLKCKWFESEHGKVFAQGWGWIIRDFKGRVFLNKNRGVKFPISPQCTIVNPQNIIFHPDTLNNFQGFGNYYQMMKSSKITIGEGTWIAPNVGLITANHDLNNLEEHSSAKDIMIGSNCWIGMNSMILPGVELGDKTIVGAGSVVTKSFKEGNCVIAGNPAKLVKSL